MASTKEPSKDTQAPQGKSAEAGETQQASTTSGAVSGGRRRKRARALQTEFLEEARRLANAGDEWLVGVGRQLVAAVDRANDESLHVVGAAKRAFQQTKTITREMLAEVKGRKKSGSPSRKEAAPKAAERSPAEPSPVGAGKAEPAEAAAEAAGEGRPNKAKPPV